MRILLIKLKHIGDALMMTPTIHALKSAYPEARVCVLVRAGTESILAGCADLDAIYLSEPPEKNKRRKNGLMRGLDLWRALRGEKFDYVFELGCSNRGFVTALASGTRNAWFTPQPRLAPKWWGLLGGKTTSTDLAGKHAVERDYLAVSRVLPLPPSPVGLIYNPSKNADASAAASLPVENDPFIVLHPCTRWRRKQWPEAHWHQLVDLLLRETDVSILLSVGPAAEEIAFGDRLCAAFPNRVLSTRGAWSFGRLAQSLKTAKFYLGVDTAAMHLAAACECPVIALFGESDPVIWSPWKTPFTVFRGGLITPPPPPPAPKRVLDDIPVAAVLAACKTYLRTRPVNQEVVDV